MICIDNLHTYIGNKQLICHMHINLHFTLLAGVYYPSPPIGMSVNAEYDDGKLILNISLERSIGMYVHN